MLRPRNEKSIGLNDDATLTSCKSSRSAGTDTFIYLRENSENDPRLKEEELELKKRKQELLETQQKAQIDEHSSRAYETTITTNAANDVINGSDVEYS